MVHPALAARRANEAGEDPKAVKEFKVRLGQHAKKRLNTYYISNLERHPQTVCNPKH